jgi:hypothetical protein
MIFPKILKPTSDILTSLMAEKYNVRDLLSELTDHEPNIYEMTKDLAGIAKQIKEDTKEDPEPPKSIQAAIVKLYESRIISSN